MKTTKEIYVDKKVRTVLECKLCGSTTYVKASMDAKTPKDAIERSCRACTPFKGLINQVWWQEYGLKKNPYVFGPMPRLRTGLRYRIEEARRMGWMAWTWHNEYEEERKGVQPQHRDKGIQI